MAINESEKPLRKRSDQKIENSKNQSQIVACERYAVKSIRLKVSIEIVPKLLL